MHEYYKGKLVLVTGGAGSIGSEIVRDLVKRGAIVRIFDNNETGIFDMINETGARGFVGDIRDYERLKRAFEDVDILFHAAALKHVTLCEHDPFDAVKTNIDGTRNVLNAALDANVEKVINISTDKAVDPLNVMGATKLLAERMTIAANHYRGKHRKSIFSSVRFGNVLNSRGSVIPIFKKQISNGGPLTITDKRMTRFFMTIQDSVNFILMVGEMARGREVFVLKMPSVKITDLADVMIRKYSPKKKVKTIITGKRMGEKYHEYLMTEEESERAYEMGNIIAILPEPLPFEDKNLIKPPDGFIRMKEKITSSERGTVSRQEIINLLKRIRNGEQ